MLFFTREQRIVIAVALIVLVASAGGLFYQSRQAVARSTETLLVESPLPSIERLDQLTVHVAGLVKQPGVYKFRYGSRVQDALKAAGGATARGDAHALNLAALLKDGEKIEVRPPEAAGVDELIRSRGTPPSASALRSTKPSTEWLARHKVNLNRANRTQLELLPGIGPGMAQRILSYRKDRGGFTSIEDLKNVSGIGAKRFAALRDFITV